MSDATPVSAVPANAQPLNLSNSQPVPVAATIPQQPLTQFNALSGRAIPPTIEFEVDGMRVEMSEPTRVGISHYVNGVMKDVEFEDAKMLSYEEQKIKSLVYVSGINGATQDRIQTSIARLELEQKLGPRVTQAVLYMYLENFAKLDTADIKIIKKS